MGHFSAETWHSPGQLSAGINMLLFDWIAERHSTEIVMKLGLSAEEAELYSQSLRKRPK